jgi:hypothetical protein
MDSGSVAYLLGRLGINHFLTQILKMAYAAIIKGEVEDDVRNIEVDDGLLPAEPETAKTK